MVRLAKKKAKTKKRTRSSKKSVSKKSSNNKTAAQAKKDFEKSIHEFQAASVDMMISLMEFESALKGKLSKKTVNQIHKINKRLHGK